MAGARLLLGLAVDGGATATINREASGKGVTSTTCRFLSTPSPHSARTSSSVTATCRQSWHALRLTGRPCGAESETRTAALDERMPPAVAGPPRRQPRIQAVFLAELGAQAADLILRGEMVSHDRSHG